MIVRLFWRVCGNIFIRVSGLKDLPAQKDICKAKNSYQRDPVPTSGRESLSNGQTVSAILCKCGRKIFAESIILSEFILRFFVAYNFRYLYWLLVFIPTKPREGFRNCILAAHTTIKFLLYILFWSCSQSLRKAMLINIFILTSIGSFPFLLYTHVKDYIFSKVIFDILLSCYQP